MTDLPKRNFALAPLLIGTLLLICALVFYYFAVLRIDYHKTFLLNLMPYPDASEYFAQARAILKYGRPVIQIADQKLPPIFPPGYPALMVPWLKVLPEQECVLAPFRTNETLGFLLLLSIFIFYLYLAMPLTGGFAALLLATLPGFFTYCRSSLSELSAAALYVPAFMFAYLGVMEKRPWKIYLSAFFLGLAVNVRLQSFFFVPLLLSVVLLPMTANRLRWLLRCTCVAIVFILAVSPTLLLNIAYFHSPFRTGVGFWYEPRVLFSFHYIRNGIIPMLWREFTLQPRIYHIYGRSIEAHTPAHVFGTGTIFVPAFLLLVCAGLFFTRVSRAVVCVCVAGLSFFVSILIYKFPEGRYYLPLLILSVAVAILPVTWAAKNLCVPRRMIASLCIMILFAAAIWGYPSRSGYGTAETNRSQAWDALNITTPAFHFQSYAFIAQQRFIQLFGTQPAVVLSDINPVYLNALFPEGISAAPIDEKHAYRYSDIWRYDRPQAMALAKRALDRSIPVYALFISRDEMLMARPRLPSLPAYLWSEIASQDHFVVAKLMPVGAPKTFEQ